MKKFLFLGRKACFNRATGTTEYKEVSFTFSERSDEEAREFVEEDSLTVGRQLFELTQIPVSERTRDAETEVPITAVRAD